MIEDRTAASDDARPDREPLCNRLLSIAARRHRLLVHAAREGRLGWRDDRRLNVLQVAIVLEMFPLSCAH
jgi:hypothetical protein